MPTTAPSQLSRRLFLAGAAVAGCSVLAAADPPDTPINRLAVFAGALNRGDSVSALSCFDKSAPAFGAIENYIEALTAQTEVSCTIEPVSESGEDPARTLETDWFMQLTARTSETASERRRQRIIIEMRLEQQKNRQEWRILTISPVSILFPINIR